MKEPGNERKQEKYANRIGFCSSLLMALITLGGLLVVKPPISGPFAMGERLGYPYLDILAQFPKDYIWMYFMILLMIVYVVFMVSVHYSAEGDKNIFSLIGLSFALISATILISNYFVQLSVIQPSLLNGETDGISLLTQYNPHGVFIALEEIGYLMMSVSFIFIAPVYYKRSALEHAASLVFILSFIFSVAALIFISIGYGIHREYIFECVVIVIDWLVLIINGLLLSIVFRRKAKLLP
jgi:hypothetical protein